MREETFEELERKLWRDPESLTEEELERLLVICQQKEGVTDENYLTALRCA